MTVCSKKHLAMESPGVDVFPRSFPLYPKVCNLYCVSRASPAEIFRPRPLAYAAMAKQPSKDRPLCELDCNLHGLSILL